MNTIEAATWRPAITTGTEGQGEHSPPHSPHVAVPHRGEPGDQRVLLHRARARIRRHLEQEAVW
jgi:hypothetical protein